MIEIFFFLNKMLPFVIISLPIILLFRATNYYKLKKKKLKINLYREIAIIFFSLFLVSLISQTILPIVYTEYHFKIISSDFGNNISRINIIPFKVIFQTKFAIDNGNINYFIINFLGNIIMFIPIGFFPSLLKEISIKKVILIGFLTSFIIELIQIFLDRGTDIDDIWLNTLGTIIGYIIFLIIQKKKPQIISKIRLTNL